MKPNIFISLLGMLTCYQHFSLLMSKEKLKRTVGFPIFPFSLCHHFQNKWLANAVK